MYGHRPRPVASKQFLPSEFFIAPGLNQPRARLGTLLLCESEESTDYKCKLVKN